MKIIATNENVFVSDPAPAGNHVARCIKMIHIGTIEETSPQFGTKSLNKVQITWELSNELKVWKDGEDEKPYVVSKEYTLSMGDKANLRKELEAWRGRPFTADQIKAFDVSKLLDVPCMLNVVHTPNKKDPSKVYATVASIAPLAKGVTCPEAFNEIKALSYDDFDWEFFNSLPDFLKKKIESSEEYKKLTEEETPQPAAKKEEKKPEYLKDAVAEETEDADYDDEDSDDLPF